MVFVSLFVAFMGVAALLNTIGSPRFATYYPPDVVRLVAAGMCFGGALTGLAMWFRGRRSS